MKWTSRVFLLGLWITVTGLMGGCSSGAHSIASRPPETNPPTYLAPLTCWDSESCCVERNPFTAVESCGADPTRVVSILKRLAEAYATLESTSGAETPPTAEGTETTQAEAAAQRVPPWKKKCIEKYVRCVNENWAGRCDGCLRRCEGQREWPQHMCPDPQLQN